MFETTFAATSGRSSAGPRSKRLTNIPRIPVIVEARIALLSGPRHLSHLRADPQSY